MRLDFSSLPLKHRAFSDKPAAFIDDLPKAFLVNTLGIAAIETGDRAAREHWQQRQLENLLTHCANRSAIWRRRIGAHHLNAIQLRDLPVQSRADVVAQVESEGSLMHSSDLMPTKKHSASGASGAPIHFFTTEYNSNYNAARSLAQYFMEGRDLSLNRTRASANATSNKPGFTVKKAASWLEPLAGFLRSGIDKHIEYFQPRLDVLRQELQRDEVGYLVAQPDFMELMLHHFGPDFFSRAGTAMVISVSATMSPELRRTFDSLGIAVRANYMAEEVGLIAAECDKIPGVFHVSTSSVIVEIAGADGVQTGDRQVGRVLVTHLHSYATPFVRYDLGDTASLDARCPCGHDGPVICNIVSGAKSA